MLRVIPKHVATPILRPFVRLRPRVAPSTPVFATQPERTIAVRGHVRNGSAAALILEPDCVCVVSADRSGRRRVRRFTVPEVLAVEEHRGQLGSEILLVTASTTVSIVDVETAQAWTFCRELRHVIRKPFDTRS